MNLLLHHEGNNILFMCCSCDMNPFYCRLSKKVAGRTITNRNRLIYCLEHQNQNILDADAGQQLHTSRETRTNLKLCIGIILSRLLL